MFGWEFPPRLSGGLGRVCQALTGALARRGCRVTFVAPTVAGDEAPAGVTLLSPPPTADATGPRAEGGRRRWSLHPYRRRRPSSGPAGWSYLAGDGVYGEDLMAEVEGFGERAAALVEGEDFDVIYGHDWMTVPACLRVKRLKGRPYVFHCHSLEYDRGVFPDDEIAAVEREGLKAADVVIAVSRYTKERIVRLHGIAEEKVVVVHNGVDEPARPLPAVRGEGEEKVVLFLGRVTYQKGPEYFVEAAARVLGEMPEVTFVMAGTGDLLPRMVERVAELKIGRRFRFTGFLEGEDLERILSESDLLVMPSVSEPFGLAALEALVRGVPVCVSRTSGVAEVVESAVKVDCSDAAAMAGRIVDLLRDPALRREMARKAREEIKGLTWEAASGRIMAVLEGLRGGGA